MTIMLIKHCVVLQNGKSNLHNLLLASKNKSNSTAHPGKTKALKLFCNKLEQIVCWVLKG